MCLLFWHDSLQAKRVWCKIGASQNPTCHNCIECEDHCEYISCIKSSTLCSICFDSLIAACSSWQKGAEKEWTRVKLEENCNYFECIDSEESKPWDPHYCWDCTLRIDVVYGKYCVKGFLFVLFVGVHFFLGLFTLAVWCGGVWIRITIIRWYIPLAFGVEIGIRGNNHQFTLHHPWKIYHSTPLVSVIFHGLTSCLPSFATHLWVFPYFHGCIHLKFGFMWGKLHHFCQH